MSDRGFSAADLGKLAAHGSLYLSKPEQIDETPWLLPYAHYLKQAWKELPLAGVLCVDGRPAVYVCEVDTFSREEVQRRQQFTWNQGVVPLLILICNANVQVHSAVRKPLPRVASPELIPASLPSLIEDLEITKAALTAQKLVRSIETGHYYQQHADFFPATETVDACLLDNLLHTARRLSEVRCSGWTRERSHALLGRVLFVKFLEARRFIKPHHFPQEANSLEKILAVKPVEEAKRLLYREFFSRMRQEFNGTMFDDDLAKEERLMLRGHLEVVADFLAGADMPGRQLTLGFWAYDFTCIPVEIISSIYEEFMEGEDAQKKRRAGAVYTPRHLTETTLHIALEGRYGRSCAWRVLDPSCGSGIFLGAIFNLLAAQWLRDNPDTPKATKAKELLRILQEQIRGVEINYGACRIAAFSLYLALFEKLQPIDLDEFKEKVRRAKFLPTLVWQAGAEENPEHPVIMCGDFLKDTLPLEKNLDLIIGNPPWTGRAEKQLALHFTRKAPEFLKEGGMGCLLLPSTILVNSNGVLDADFFRSVRVEKIVQLADFRKVLFHASHPCFVLRFVKQVPDPRGTITYETPKLNRYDRRRGVIVVEPDDQKLVRWQEVMQAANAGRVQSLWSRKFWGSPRDEAFLRRLDAYPPLSELVGKRGKTKRWLGGTGFQPHYPETHHQRYQPAAFPWPLTDPYLPARDENLNLVIFADEFAEVGIQLKAIGASVEKVLFARSEANFAPPMVIYNEGFSRFAFCSHRVLFQNALRSIAGSAADTSILQFLAAVLGSKLMRYHAFHCGSSNGIGRDKLHLHESLALPFPLPDDELAAANAGEIIESASGILQRLEQTGARMSRAERDAAAAEARAELEPLVENYYSVSSAERLLIEDTLQLWKESIHKTNLDADIPAIAFPEDADRECYAGTLCEELARFSRRKEIRISAEAKVSEELNLVFMTVVFGAKQTAYKETEGDAALWEALKGVEEAASGENGSLHYLRGFTYFEQDRVHILKPATLRNWSRTAALNDADAIFEHQITHRA